LRLRKPNPAEALQSARVPNYTVAVRTLCELVAKEGDLDLRFTPSPTAQQGIAGHRAVFASRAHGYRSEITLSAEYEGLVVRGRADGFDPEHGRLEEVKTCACALDRIPPNHTRLHWAQAKVYGALVCRQLGLTELTVALVYFDVRSQQELPALEERHCAQALWEYFERLCERFLAWARQEATHRVERDRALQRLCFPHAGFRPGQRDLAKAVYRAARAGGCLLVQAPTGSGKTIATLFPMLKACPTEDIDKLFFLTAKTSGRALALNAIETLRAAAPGLPLRVLELTAREKACEHPDKACHGESCPLARGFYDRLPAARAAAVASAAPWTRGALRELARAHAICPYYLGQALAQWSDVIVADYNHYFDRSALLYGATQANGWRVGLLIDEAHNLPQRAQAMYSASLAPRALRAARARAPADVRRVLERLRRSWSQVARETTSAYASLDKPPPRLATALREACAALGEHFTQAVHAPADELLAFYFDALAFEAALADFGAHSLFDLVREPEAERASQPTLSIRNVVPAPFLRSRFGDAHTAILFSATLQPWHYYIDMLGLPAEAGCIDLPSPFSAEQLQVRIVPRVSTRYRDRMGSLASLAGVIARQYERQPGNYLAYVSSFDYLDRLAEVFAVRHGGIPAWRQERHMGEEARAQFLARFAPEGRGVGFAVLGGAFGEGIDLVGTRLIGVFVATLGLPQFDAVNEQMRRRLQALFGAGFDYTYLYPGIRKVVQACGRVIRSETDRGSVHLIDDRYARPEVLRLLPRWWRIEKAAAERAPPKVHIVSPGCSPHAESGALPAQHEAINR
jgi:DNA excision repair protein ERCC-2